MMDGTRRTRRQRRARHAIGVACAAALLLAAGAGTAHAADPDDAPVYAVQNREYNLKHEFRLGIGVLPINAYVKGLTLGGGYTYHFGNVWAWEIVDFHYAFGIDTNLKQELLENYAVSPTQISSLQMFAHSSVIAKPLYGKFAITNKSVVHAEMFFALGAGVGLFINPQAPRVGFDVGAGLRFHLSHYFSLRIDLRDLTYFKSDNGHIGTANELYLGLSLALSFGGGQK
jgi:outer membrane beta-barrel protein